MRPLFPSDRWMIAWLKRGLYLTALLALLPAWSAQPKSSKQKTPPSESLFTNATVFRIQIEIPEAGLATLRDYQWGGWGGTQGKRASVKATVREDDKVYRDVAIHLKGAAGSFRPVDDSPAMTLNFDKHVKGQTFHGLERLSLNNSVQDRSLLNEQISRELFAQAGVPVPRATHAKVELNGRDLGVYVLTEAYNKQFLARHFKNPNGNFYDGGFLKDVTDDLEKASGPDPNDRSDLKRLAAAAMEDNLTNRWARLNAVLDVDRFLSYLAMDVITCDWDGYAINRNNYRVYHDPDTDKIVFMPHGLDQMFGVMRADTDMPIFPRMSGLVAKALLQTTEGRRQYRERIKQLMDQVYNAQALTNRVWEAAARIRPVLTERGGNSGRSFDREVKHFCERILNREQSIRQQLTAPDKTLKFGPDGIATLSGWRGRSEFGKPVVEESTDGGKAVLRIVAGGGSSVGVWATKVLLDPGRYRFECRAKCQGVVTDPGDRKGGAGLRVSGRRIVQKLVGDSDWTELAFEFDAQGEQSPFGFMAPIQSGVPEFELICELRAAKGQVWFDRDSLRLIRK